MDKLYLIFYCLVRDDQTNTVHSRTKYLFEIFLSLVFFAISEIIIGLVNLRFNSFVFYILIGIICLIFAHLLVNERFSEIKGKAIIQRFSALIDKKKTSLVLLGISLFIGAFILLILNGILMSYLFSFYE